MTISRLENHRNSNWGEVVFRYEKKEYRFPYHILSGEIFNLDPKNLVRAKCLALIGLTPLVSVGRSVYWFVQSIFLILAKGYYYLDGPSDDKNQVAWSSIKELASDSLRALWYGAKMTGYACMGIVDPYQARHYYGRLERGLNRHSDGPHRDKFYLAFCFQRLCVLPKDYPDHSEEITRKLNRNRVLTEAVDEVQSSIFTCSYQEIVKNVKALVAELNHKETAS